MDRINLTNNEMMAAKMAEGTDADCKTFTLGNDMDSLIKQEKAEKFNNQVEAFNEMLEENNKKCEENKESLQYDIDRAEIKPMFARIIVKPFSQNPFQKIQMKGKLIIDAGGYTPHTQLNPQTGKYEEQKEFIVTGCIVEVGPETKYLKEGDVIYYRVDTSVPVPFFKQGFISLNENQVIAVVNENLTERFNKIKE